MARAIDPVLLDALTQPAVRIFHAVEMLFDAAPVRFWTGYGEKTINGETYTGTGQLLSLGDMQEASDLSAQSVTLTLSGISSEIVALALAEPYQRRPCRIMFGEMTVAPVVTLFSGLMNTMTIEDAGESSTISLLVDSKLVELQRAKERRYTHESQQARYPGDTFFSYVTDLQDKSFNWGRTG
ncbi:hypothetical protein V8J36_05280 [Frigidibacter sp. MR17.14]|uniref:hypothetical protein n=1 Tax=Frigidibacter sp. MR17.14 TaxID=3126509 RepID=UPI0030131A01